MNDDRDRDEMRSKKIQAGVASVVAVAAVVAAIAALTRGGDEAAIDGEAATQTVEPLVESTLEPEWSIDARTAFGREFAAFISPAGGLMFGSGSYGIIDGGDVLVAAAGLPNPRTYMVDDAKLMGIDARDGAVLWSIDPGGVDSCGTVPVRGEVLCLDSFADVPAVVAVGLRDGAIRRIPLPDGWFPFEIESDGQSVYLLDGNPEDSESVLRGGSVDALADSWSLPIDAFAPWEGVEGTLIHVHDGRGVVTLGGEAEFFDPGTGSRVDDLEMGTETSVVDAGSGKEVWQLADPYALELTVGTTVYSDDGSSITAVDTETDDLVWTWALPTGSDGFTASGVVIGADSGVYFLDSDSVVLLERSE